MEPIYIPNEQDFKRWIKEAVTEALQDSKINSPAPKEDDLLLNRKEVAKLLRISLVTLTDWVKIGLPSHKHRGRIYFDKNEVLAYIKEEKLKNINFTSRLHHLKKDFK